ncbi:antigen 5 like allergen Cul n 1-like isoform X2 [Armigeres subalbatus]|uniref:antigen 5 like allergen Cul n 1-like isoform X2 n=1 Tax=Armigeres subalbatus TaxID=124917 RepID=UPI002ED0EDB2
MDTANYRRLISRRQSSPPSSPCRWLSLLMLTLIGLRYQSHGASFDLGSDVNGFEYDYGGVYYGEDFTAEGTTVTEPPVTVTETTEERETAEELVFTTETETAAGSDFYCQEDLCLQYDFTGQLVAKKHVACGHDRSFAEDCPVGRTLFKIDPQIRAFILHLHNEARNRLANGSVSGFESALRMPTVEWDDELAELAELNAKSCQFKHDECRNTDLYRQAGQNLALGYYPVAEDIFDILEKLTNLWFNEYKDATQEVMDEYNNLPNVTIGHFTQMVSDRTTKIGCGIVIYPKKVSGFTFKVVLYACNYSITSIFGQPVYRKGPSAASCTTGSNEYYESLCSTSENQLVKSVPFYDI